MTTALILEVSRTTIPAGSFDVWTQSQLDPQTNWDESMRANNITERISSPPVIVQGTTYNEAVNSLTSLWSRPGQDQSNDTVQIGSTEVITMTLL